METKPFIHLFETQGRYYLLDVNTSKILKIPRNVYENLSESDKKDDYEAKVYINSLRDKGFLSANRVSEVAHPKNELLPYYLDNHLSMVTLQVTQSCNLRCSYCVYSGAYNNRYHSNNKMDLSTAKSAIDFFIRHSGESQRSSIGFYGGEPLLEFTLIKQAIEYAKEKSQGRNTHFTMTTNGTLLNKEIVEFLSQHDVDLLISLDGPKSIHDKHRKFASNSCGTFDKVMENMEIIKRCYPEYISKIGFSVVLDPENGFSCTNEFFTNYDTIKESRIMVSEINNRYSKKPVNNNSIVYRVERNYEMFKFFLAKLKKLDGNHVSKLLLYYEGVLKQNIHDLTRDIQTLPSRCHHGGPCMPGVQRFFVNYKGDFYPCERVSETSEVMKIGNLKDGFNVNNIMQIMNIGQITQVACKNCWAFKFCQTCAAFADNLTEFSAKQKLSHCAAVKSQVENMLKDYCFLREYGYDFNDDLTSVV